MNTKLYPAILALSVVMAMVGCASTGDDRPLPGTPEATDTKKSAAENNTPETHPVSYPDSQPPDSTTQVIVTH